MEESLTQPVAPVAQPSQPAPAAQAPIMDVVAPSKPAPTPAAVPMSDVAEAPVETEVTAKPEEAAKPVAVAKPAKQPKSQSHAPVGAIVLAIIVLISLSVVAVMVYQKG